MKIKKRFIGLIGLGVLTIACNALAHTTVLKKNTPADWGARNELEGSGSSVSAFTIPHGCTAPDSERPPKSVTAQAIVWPNGHDSVAVRSDTREEVTLADEIDGNPVMSPKPAQDHNIFRRIKVAEDSVPTFFNHGERTSDVRAFHYSNGKLESFLLGIMPYRVSYPTFKPESCATKMRVNIAIANYCTRSKNLNNDDRADIWIGHLTEKFNDPDVVSEGFWPHVMVVRDLENNPLGEGCGEGYEIEVSPGAASIDTYLPIRDYWPQ